MRFLLLALALALNFIISWANATYVGRYWFASKKVGGSFRAYIVAGYIMAISGFTMVYAYILLLIFPFFLQMAKVNQETILMFEQLASDLVYLFCVITIIPTGFYLWIRSLKKFWEEKTLANGLSAGWNTYAQSHNTMSVSRNAPSAFRRVSRALLGGTGKNNTEKNKSEKDNSGIVLYAFLLLILAILGGYFTATTIMLKAARKYRKYNMSTDL